MVNRNALVTALCLSLFCFGFVGPAWGQAEVAFNNYSPSLSPVTINSAPGAFNPGDGPAGAFVGSNYSASLLTVAGMVTNQVAFNSLNPRWLGDTLFFGSTGIGSGHGITGDGSGFFDGGTLPVTELIDFYATFQVWVWYNGGGLYTSPAQALAAGRNVGQSELLPLYVSLPPGPINNLSGLQPFTVGIPEPPTIVLTALGGCALLLFRRRK